MECQGEGLGSGPQDTGAQHPSSPQPALRQGGTEGGGTHPRSVPGTGGRTDRWTNEWTHQWTEGSMDRWVDGQMDQREMNQDSPRPTALSVEESKQF